MSLKTKYLSSAMLLLATTIIVKIIGAVYKIPLTAFIGAVGRGYFAYAYNLCMPVHAVTMGVFPIALSRLVSRCASSSNSDRALPLLKASIRLFSLIGFVGMALLIAAARPYAALIAHSPKSVYTILVLAPSVLFSCMSAAYRGYYEGFLNMLPTSVSQLIEAVLKLAFGLLLARASMAYLYSQYLNSGCVLSNPASCEEEALSLIYPVTSACAMLGVTIGTALSLAFLCAYRAINTRLKRLSRQSVRLAAGEILSFSLPMIVSTGVQSVFQFFDTTSVQLALNHINPYALSRAYKASLELADVAAGDIPTYAYGLYSAALDFKNLIPGVTMALGVCAVPAVSRACEEGREALAGIVNSIFRYTVLLSSLGGVALFACSSEVLGIFYSSSSPDIVVGASDLVRWFALSVPLYSLAGVAVFTVQAVGEPRKTIMPFLVSGIVRTALNYILIRFTSLALLSTVISGAVGYMIICIWCIASVARCRSIRIDCLSLVIKPLFVLINTVFVCYFIEKAVFQATNLYFVLLFKALILTGFYCILCFFCNLINPGEILSLLPKKKLA